MRFHAVRMLPGVGSLRRKRVQLGCFDERLRLGDFGKCDECSKRGCVFGCCCKLERNSCQP